MDEQLPAPAAAPGWYPVEGAGLRWWDGREWGPPMPEVRRPGEEVDAGRGPAVLAHLGMFVFAVLLPIVVRQTAGRTNSYVRHHATEALNFQLTFSLVWVVAVIGTAIAAPRGLDADNGALVAMAVALAVLYVSGLACAVTAAVRAGQRRWWVYPASIRFVSGAREGS